MPIVNRWDHLRSLQETRVYRDALKEGEERGEGGEGEDSMSSHGICLFISSKTIIKSQLMCAACWYELSFGCPDMAASEKKLPDVLEKSGHEPLTPYTVGKYSTD